MIIYVAILILVLLLLNNDKTGFKMIDQEPEFQNFLKSCEMFRKIDSTTFGELKSKINHFLKIKFYIVSEMTDSPQADLSTLEMIGDSIYQTFETYSLGITNSIHRDVYENRLTALGLLITNQIEFIRLHYISQR